MSDIVITARNLGKQYVLSHRRSEAYQTLRETMMEAVMRPLSRCFGMRDPDGTKNGRAVVADRRAADAGTADEYFWALREIDFEIKQGEVVGIIGRNGAGKSTLLKILSRITEPTCGRVSIEGRVCSLLEVGTGFHPELTGRENIYLNGAILGMKRAEIRHKFDEIVAFAEVEKFLDMPVKRYSSGMYIRLAFAVAAHLDPEIMVVDEVLAVGDAHFQRKCLGKMKDVAATQGRTVLFVSHNMPTILSLCRKAILLKDGKIAFQGDTRTAVSQYLSEGPESTGVTKYPPDPLRKCQVMEVRVRNQEGTVTNHVEVSSPFTIEIDFEVRERMKGVYVALSLLSEMQENILGTCDYDMDPSQLEERQPGRYRTSVKIPAGFLNAGRANVVVGIATLLGKILHDRKEVMQIELVDEHSFVARRGGELRPGSILLMEIPWKTSRHHDREPVPSAP